MVGYRPHNIKFILNKMSPGAASEREGAEGPVPDPERMARICLNAKRPDEICPGVLGFKNIFRNDPFTIARNASAYRDAEFKRFHACGNFIRDSCVRVKIQAMQIGVDQIIEENIAIKEFQYLEAQLVDYVLGVVAGEEPAGNFGDYLEHADVPAESGANIFGGCLLSRAFQVCCLERNLLHFNGSPVFA